MGISTKIILGDCSEKLKEMADSTIDLIITSPPLMPTNGKILTVVSTLIDMLNGL